MEDNKKKKPFYKKWWFWLVAFLVFGFAVGQSSDDYEDTEEVEVAEKTDDQEKEEKKEKDDSDKEEQAKTDEEERKENRTTAEAIEEDSSNVDEADIDGDELVLKYNPGTVWDENSFMSTVYEMFKDVKVAFDDEDINSVQVMIETEMTDEKGNEETETIIKYNYKRDTFEELNYDNFIDMSMAEEWRILKEADYHYIHPGIYKNLKEKHKDNIDVEGFN